MRVGRTPKRGLRGAKLLGNANNDANAGSLYLNGNNAVSDANANWGVFLNKTYTNKGVSQTQRSNIAEMAASLVAHEGERPTCREVFADTHQAHQDPAQDPAKTPFSYPQKNPSYA